MPTARTARPHTPAAARGTRLTDFDQLAALFSGWQGRFEQLTAGRFQAGYAPFVVAGQGLETDLATETYSATNALISTDDYAEPGYSVRAKRISIVPGEYIEAWDGTLYLGKVPVMYFPHYKRSLGRHPNNFSFVPGYRSRFGPYLLSASTGIGTSSLTAR